MPDFANQPVDYAQLIGQGQKLVFNPLEARQQAAQTGLLNAQAQAEQLQAQAAQQKQARFSEFQNDIHTYDGSPTAASKLMAKYPEYADQLKSSWDLQDNAKKQADLTATSEIYSAAQNGAWKLAQKLAHQRADAEKAAGNELPAGYSESMDVLDKAADGDPTSQKVVLNMLGMHLAATTGADHFGTVYGKLTEDGGYTLPEGGARFDSTNHMVAHSPLLKDADGNIHAWNDSGTATGGGGPASGAGGSVSPASASVASALASSGMPAPVVAGFMGNFHAEGGYDGAQGDGGSASGIGQWRGERAANFEKVIGKPVTEATPAEQAKFVSWEMQNPETAGMTVKQRDAILAAKSPAQAAALIDQFYERSSGRDRNIRMAAATAFAGDGSTAPQGSAFPVLIPGKGKEAPAGYQWAADGKSLEPIPGGPKDPSSGDDVLKKYNIAPGETGPSVLAKLPANLSTQVKALAEGRIPVPSSMALAKPYWQTMLQLTAQYDPTFDAASAPARKAAITAFTGMGKGAQLVGSINRVANHMQLLWNESHNLAGPDTGFGPLDTALATGGQAFERAHAKAYDGEVTFVAGELGKLAKAGVVTEGETERIIKNLDRRNSAKTRQSAIQAAVGIISGAVDPLKDQYNSAFTNGSTRPNIPWVTPKAQEIFRNIGGVDLSLTGAGADSNNAVTSSVTHGPPAGATRTATGPKGEKAALVNGRWVPY